MIVYKLTALYGKEHVVDGVTERDGLMFATIPDNGSVPIYSIKCNDEFRRYNRDILENNENIRDGGPGDNNRVPCGPG